jgi:hypothetical protein
VTNARFASLHGLPVALLPFDDARSTTQIRALVTSGNCIGRSSGGLPSAVGGGRCAPAAFHYALLSASAPLFPLADRRPKPRQEMHKAAGPDRNAFIYVNNRLEGNALETIAAMISNDG